MLHCSIAMWWQRLRRAMPVLKRAMPVLCLAPDVKALSIAFLRVLVHIWATQADASALSKFLTTIERLAVMKQLGSSRPRSRGFC